MYRDLDPECWPSSSPITEQPLVRSLLAEGFPQQEDLIGDETNLDSILRPADMVHIVDCDSSQTRAVHKVRRGRNLVVQGPPGTGKSQTIANVIAAVVADGKTVLFLAEKMAALEVVKRRLDQAGVGDACLELHSNKANKRQFLQELSRTWDLGSPRGVSDGELSASLLTVRDELNAFAYRLHSVHDKAGLTPFQVMGELICVNARGVPPTQFPLPDAPQWTTPQREEREGVLNDVRERIVLIGHPNDHAWRGVHLPPLLPTDVTRLTMKIGVALSSIQQTMSALQGLAGVLKLNEPETLSASLQLINLAERIATAPPIGGSALSSEYWNDLTTIRALIDLGFQNRTLTEEVHDKAHFDVIAKTQREELIGALEVLERLPQSLSQNQLFQVHELLSLIPTMTRQAVALSRTIGRSESVENLDAAEVLLRIASQIERHRTSQRERSPVLSGRPRLASNSFPRE